MHLQYSYSVRNNSLRIKAIKNLGDLSIMRLLSMLAFSPHLIGGWGIYMLVVAPEHSICRN